MSNPDVSTDHWNRQNGRNYYKVFVYGPDGRMLRGSRTLRGLTGRKLKQVCQEYQADIDAGLYDPN